MNARTQPAYVEAGLGYVIRDARRPFNYMYPPPAGTPWQNCTYEQHRCRIHNARHVPSSVGLETTGFDLLDMPTATDDWQDARQVSERYYRELEDTALALTGGTRAIVFDHLLRRRDAGRFELGFGRDTDPATPSAVGRVHNDYSETSGRRRLGLVLGDTAPDRPFLILNFWRPIHHPALDTPLALCDARSFSAPHWVESDVIYPTRTGEIYLGTYNEAHAWYYYPGMTTRELLVFKTYDSRLDHPVRMTPHCAFDDPCTPSDAPLRRSIEARCLVVLE